MLYNAAPTDRSISYITKEILYRLAQKGATREAKGAEAPPLAKSKLRYKIKYQIVLIFFVSWLIHDQKIVHYTVKLQNVTCDSFRTS